MSESNNNIPMRITQLEEATAYEDGMYYAVAKAGRGTKKISCENVNRQISDLKNAISDISESTYNLWDGEGDRATIDVSTGVVTLDGSSNYTVSSFIEVSPTILYYIGSAYTSFLFVYNASKQYIGFYGTDVKGRDVVLKDLNNSFASAKYIRIRFTMTVNLRDIIICESKYADKGFIHHITANDVYARDDIYNMEKDLSYLTQTSNQAEFALTHGQNNWVKFIIKAGKAYQLSITSGAAVVSTCLYENDKDTTTETLAANLSYTTPVNKTATYDAKWLRIYANSDCTFKIIEKDTTIYDMQSKISYIESNTLLDSEYIPTYLGKGYMYMSGDNLVIAAASVMRAYYITLNPNYKYDILTNMYGFSGNRVFWATTSKKPTAANFLTFTSTDFIRHGDEVATFGNDIFIPYSLTPETGEKYLMIITGDSAFYNFPIIKAFNERNEQVSSLIATEPDVSMFGGTDMRTTNYQINEDGSITFTGNIAFPIIKRRKTKSNLVFKLLAKASVFNDGVYVNFKSDNNLFGSIRYNIDSNDFKWYEFRIPACGNLYDYCRVIFNVSSGQTLTIRNMGVYEESLKNTFDCGVRLSAHLGCYGYAPENTIIGAIMAHNMGYPSCIMNPQLTSDDVLVCCHDTTINRTARNADGTTIVGDVSIADSTYEELLDYDFGIYISSAYKGTKIGTVEEFFNICAETNMQPIFSVHQGFNSTTWGSIKDMLGKRNLLHKMTIKSGDITVLSGAYNILGSDIYAYIFDTEDGDISSIITTLRNSVLGSATCKIGIEISKDYITKEKIDTVLAAGFFAGMYDVFAFPSYKYKEYMSYGISEIVDDFNPSYGLHW